MFENKASAIFGDRGKTLGFSYPWRSTIIFTYVVTVTVNGASNARPPGESGTMKADKLSKENLTKTYKMGRQSGSQKP